MMKILIAGLWVCIVTLAAVYLGSLQNGTRADTESEEDPPLEILTLKPITVPVVNAEGVEGYLLAVLGYNIDKSKLDRPLEALAPALQDESFRALYGVEATKFRKPRNSDLAEISSRLIEVVNKRLASEAVKEVLIEELSFIPKEKVRTGRGG